MASATVRRAALVMAPLMFCGTITVMSMGIAGAGAVPTCRGAPATIVGTARDDILTGTDSDDVIVGGGGLDEIFGDDGDDVICGGPTRYKEILGDPVFQTLEGGDGDDVVVGGSGDEGVFGGRGADLLIGNAGNDDMQGDGGIPRGGDDTLLGGPGFDFMNGDRGVDRIFGGTDADILFDYDGANLVHGGPGADRLESGPGNERLEGGPGLDVASYVQELDDGGSRSHGNNVTADLSRGIARGEGFGVDTLRHVESIWTGGGNDILIGDDGPNGFYTGGFPGNPEDFGAATHDTVRGKGGADRISFDSVSSESGSAPGPVRVDLRKHTALWDNQGSPNPLTLTLHSIENVKGTEYRDVILGNARANRLSGGFNFSNDGDVLSGRRGADTLFGQAGNDSLYGGRGPDHLSGSSGNDRLFGGTGRNRNDGGNGIDTCVRPKRGPFASSCER